LLDISVSSALLHIERGFGGRDQQSKYKSGHRSNESHSELYNILGVINYVILRQRSAKEYPEKRTTKNDRERQEADRNGLIILLSIK
jgi:hypothetical protein